jgi:hypothetical protein
MKKMMIRFAVAVVLPLALAGASVAADKMPTDKLADPTAMCAATMKGTGPDGQKAMGEFMQSDRAPQAMAKMAEMARRMGDGDPMLGMTRMMEMMGGRMMGGQDGMMSPRGAQPGK